MATWSCSCYDFQQAGDNRGRVRCYFCSWKKTKYMGT